MNLGRFELALNVADLNASLTFYRRLGFNQIDGSEESGVAVIQSGNCRIALYKGYIAENLINFRGGDIPAIAERAKTEGLTFEKEPFSGPDGGMGALIRDPDGNAVYFVSHPDE
jgi:catechol 2,3-dioxygenase-like lactoylglutathione lyase family enzyme